MTDRIVSSRWRRHIELRRIALRRPDDKRLMQSPAGHHHWVVDSGSGLQETAHVLESSAQETSMPHRPYPRLRPHPAVLAVVFALSCTRALAANATFPANGVRYDTQLFRDATQACAAFVKGFGRGSVSGAPKYEDQGRFRCYFKDGDDEKDQIAAYVDCPPQASAAGPTTCHCDGTLVYANGACVEPSQAEADAKDDGTRDEPGPAATTDAKDDNDCAALDALEADKLKDELTERVGTLTERAHSEFAADPSIAMQVLTENEVAYMFGGGGYRPNPNVEPGKDVQTMTERMFNVLYGKALERLAARHVKGDACVSRYIDHLSDAVQMSKGHKEGGAPDFLGKGKAKGLELDITTPQQVPVKKGKGKEYKFITYQRRLRLDETGKAVKL
ncbi:hypothetical protein [Pyxidicoccus xibeiensis]|uniref:hypothetical protein n=1 Tax=Pyxidicoccus xibeiensis TaxID=2906759 RepID=UPI0020A82943|nr:hypothetical protein [Pyxidicoccus xibeiensis]MCP3143499.1 hypothetical protein [Pyxidicoccus xibeiensis]